MYTFFILPTILNLPITHAWLYLPTNFSLPSIIILPTNSRLLLISFIRVHNQSGIDHNEQGQNLCSLKYDNNICGRPRYYALTHLYASNLQQFWLAFLKMVKERTVQSSALVETLHNTKWVKMMNRSVLNVHQYQKTIWKRITTIGIVNSWKDARRLENG